MTALHSVPPRIGLVGVGLWGRNILRDLKSLGCYTPVVARSEASRSRAAEGGADIVVARIDDLPELDGVVVCTPTSTHFEVLSAVLERFPGRPIFSEKPLCTRSEHARDLSLKGDGRLFVMDKWRYHSGVLELARIARSGELGGVVGLKTRRMSWGTIHDDSNTVWHLLPHDLSIALEIFGVIPEPRAAVLDSAHGATRGMTAFLGDRPWVQAEVSDRFPVHHRELRLFCEDGVAVLADSLSDGINIYRTRQIARSSKAEPEAIPITVNMPLFDELSAFVEFVRGRGPAPRSSLQEGVRSVAVIERLFELAG